MPSSEGGSHYLIASIANVHHSTSVLLCLPISKHSISLQCTISDTIKSSLFHQSAITTKPVTVLKLCWKQSSM